MNAVTTTPDDILLRVDHLSMKLGAVFFIIRCEILIYF